MPRIVLLTAALLAGACGTEPGLPLIHVYVPRATTEPIHVTQGGYSLKGPPPECPRREEWDVVSWPDLELVSAMVGYPEDMREWGCGMWITPDEPFADRWYAVRWRGEELSFDPGAAGLPLRDGSWLWRFRGVTHARVTGIERLQSGARTFIQAEVSEPVDPGPGYEWASLMSVTQADVACSYPGASAAGVGFSDTIVVECVGVDWNAPVHIHVEGAVTREGAREPVPPVDLEPTFGPTGNRADVMGPPDESPPPCEDPRCE